MITKDGPKVIEYNCRFGDPETQVVLPLLESDLLDIMIKTAKGELSADDVKFSSGAAACVVVASAGYPQHYEKGYEITLPADLPDTEIYVAGAKLENGKLVNSGGRVLGVSSTAETLEEALKKAYAGAEKVKFENAFYRRDIGAKAMKILMEGNN
jgi:phosphoribosylamine--glycine ligase